MGLNMVPIVSCFRPETKVNLRARGAGTLSADRARNSVHDLQLSVSVARRLIVKKSMLVVILGSSL